MANPEDLQKLIDSGSMPAVFNHCVRVYAAMESEVNTDRIWEGALTKLLPTLNLPAPYYTNITRELKRMGCVALKQRGGGGAVSQWHVITPPTKELWTNSLVDSTTLGSKSRMTQIEQALRGLHDRLTAVELRLKVLEAYELSSLADDTDIEVPDNDIPDVGDMDVDLILKLSQQPITAEENDEHVNR